MRQIRVIIRTLLEFYVLIPFILIYFGFIYIYGKVAVYYWLNSRHTTSLSFTNNFYQDYLFPLVNDMLRVMEFGIFPFSLEFYTISGVGFLFKIIIAIMVALLISYILYKIANYFWQKINPQWVINLINGQDLRNWLLNFYLGVLVFISIYTLSHKYISFSIQDLSFSIPENIALLAEFVVGNVKGGIINQLLNVIYVLVSFLASFLLALLGSRVCYIVIKNKSPKLKSLFVIITSLFLAQQILFKSVAVYIQSDVINLQVFYEITYLTIFLFAHGLIFLIYRKTFYIYYSTRRKLSEFINYLFYSVIIVSLSIHTFNLATANETYKIFTALKNQDNLELTFITMDSKVTPYYRIDISKDFFIGVNFGSSELQVVPMSELTNISIGQFKMNNEEKVEYKDREQKLSNEIDKESIEIVHDFYTALVKNDSDAIKKYDNYGLLENVRIINDKIYYHNRLNDVIDFDVYVNDPETNKGSRKEGENLSYSEIIVIEVREDKNSLIEKEVIYTMYEDPSFNTSEEKTFRDLE